MLETVCRLYSALTVPRPVPAPDHLHKTEPECQRILITGATSGIGYQALRKLTEDGHRSFTHYRSVAKPEMLRRLYPEVMAAQLDLTDFDAWRSGPHGAHDSSLVNFRQWVEERAGKLDALVLNAGETGLSWSPQEKSQKVAAWLASNVALLELFSDLLHDFDEKHHLRGRVLFVSSALADQPLAGLESYGKIKSKTEQALEDIFGRNHPRRGFEDVLPFIVVPGSVATRMHLDEVLQLGSAEAQERTRKLISGNRLRKPEVVGAIIARLATTGLAWDRRAGDWSRPVTRLERVTIGDEEYSEMEKRLAA